MSEPHWQKGTPEEIEQANGLLDWVNPFFSISRIPTEVSDAFFNLKAHEQHQGIPRRRDVKDIASHWLHVQLNHLFPNIRAADLADDYLNRL